MEIKEALSLLNEDKYLSNNAVNKKKYLGKKNVGSTLSTLKKDAGNVEHNIAQFNKGFAGGGESSGTGGASSDGGCCGESLNLHEQDETSKETHGSHQKYRDWNKDKEEFMQGRYTPYVTTKRVKRTLDKMGFQPVEANGIMMDIQRGNAEPRHVTLETTDDGQTWSFRNETGSKMFDLEEEMVNGGPLNVQGTPYTALEDDVDDLFSDLDKDTVLQNRDNDEPVISWKQLIDGIINTLGYVDEKAVIDVAACIISYLAKNNMKVDMPIEDELDVSDDYNLD